MSPFLAQYLIIELGGALGSMLRFGLATWIESGMTRTGQIFPWGTIVVNITGCLFIGFIATLSATDGRVFLSPLTRQFIMVGICGGYTTFSSFSLQTLALVEAGQWWSATANVLLSVVLCLSGSLAGSNAGQLLESPPLTRMQIPQDAVLLRIFIGESDRWKHQPLYEAIVLRARELHLGGATVLRGAMGFGKTSRVHTAKLLNLSTDLPLVIELVDSEEKINAFLPELDQMISGGLVTMEKVKVLQYRGVTKE